MAWMPCYAFVDGAYVRAELVNRGQGEEFDPTKPAAFTRNINIYDTQLIAIRVFYYDAPDPDANQDRQAMQKAYFDRLRLLPDTHVILGELRRGKKREQKGVDVQLAIDALKAAFSGAVRAVAIISGDADFAPLARAIREAGPHVVVLAFKDSLSPSLAVEADRVWTWDATPADWKLN